MRPDVVLVDGVGSLHPRRCGCATHLGIAAGVATVGVSKSLLHMEGLQERGVREAMRLQGGGTQGSRLLPLRGASGQVLGAAVCAPGVRRPVYVSAGHLVGVNAAVAVVLQCCRHRVPEPIRLADLRSRAAARLLVGQSSVHTQTLEIVPRNAR